MATAAKNHAGDNENMCQNTAEHTASICRWCGWLFMSVAQTGRCSHTLTAHYVGEKRKMCCCHISECSLWNILSKLMVNWIMLQECFLFFIFHTNLWHLQINSRIVYRGQKQDVRAGVLCVLIPATAVHIHFTSFVETGWK